MYDDDSFISPVEDESPAVSTRELRLANALRRFAERGLSADLTPTMNCIDAYAVYAGFARYLQRIDQAVRDVALAALTHDEEEK